MPNIYVHLTPKVMSQSSTDTIGVMVDIFRASSTIITALDHGAKSVIPFADLTAWRQSAEAPHHLLAGERGGIQLPEAQLDNSPTSCTSEVVKGKVIALTTTNGTAALQSMMHCTSIIIGGCLNIDAVSKYLLSKQRDVEINCAGWNGMESLEDTYFAGALLNQLLPSYAPSNDGALIAQATYHSVRGDVKNYLKRGDHYQRLAAKGKENDINYCLSFNRHPVVPILDGYQIRLLSS